MKAKSPEKTYSLFKFLFCHFFSAALYFDDLMNLTEDISNLSCKIGPLAFKRVDR